MMTAYSFSLTRLFLLGYVCYSYTAFYLLYPLVPFPFWFALIQKSEGGFANDVYLVNTLDQQMYLLRQAKQKMDPSLFLKIIEISTKAANAGLSPTVISYDLQKQTILLSYLQTKKWETFEQNPQAYISATQALKQFHRLHVITDVAIKPPAPFHFLQTAKKLCQSSTVPSHYKLAVCRLEKLMHYLQCDLSTKNVLCHGDFHLKNILLVENSNGLKPYLIDFDTALAGHPFFDLAKFTVGLKKDQRLELLNVYLDRQATEHEQNLFHWIDITFLMLVATNRFQWASEHLEVPHFTAQELEQKLDQGHLPSYLTVPFEKVSVKDRQLGALYALAEFLQCTESLCFLR